MLLSVMEINLYLSAAMHSVFSKGLLAPERYPNPHFLVSENKAMFSP